MDSVNLEELSKDHLRSYWSILAYVPNEDFCREVWSSRRLIPFTSADGPGTEMKRLFVPVQSISDQGIKPLVEKLEGIDPTAQHRIIREIIGDDG